MPIDKSVCHPFEGVHLLNGACQCFTADAKDKLNCRLAIHAPELYAIVKRVQPYLSKDDYGIFGELRKAIDECLNTIEKP